MEWHYTRNTHVYRWETRELRVRSGAKKVRLRVRNNSGMCPSVVHGHVSQTRAREAEPKFHGCRCPLGGRQDR